MKIGSETNPNPRQQIPVIMRRQLSLLQIPSFHLFEDVDHFTKTRGSWINFQVGDGISKTASCQAIDVNPSTNPAEEWRDCMGEAGYSYRITGFKGPIDFALDVKHEYGETSK